MKKPLRKEDKEFKLEDFDCNNEKHHNDWYLMRTSKYYDIQCDVCKWYLSKAGLMYGCEKCERRICVRCGLLYGADDHMVRHSKQARDRLKPLRKQYEIDRKVRPYDVRESVFRDINEMSLENIAKLQGEDAIYGVVIRLLDDPTEDDDRLRLLPKAIQTQIKNKQYRLQKYYDNHLFFIGEYNHISEEQIKDEILTLLVYEPRKGTKDRKGVNRYRIVIPKVLRYCILDTYHKLFVHPGSDKTKILIKRDHYWMGMDEDISEYTKSCETCQIAKGGHQRKVGISETIEAAAFNQIVPPT